jgi:hypothetical protein
MAGPGLNITLKCQIGLFLNLACFSKMIIPIQHNYVLRLTEWVPPAASDDHIKMGLVETEKFSQTKI